MPKRTAKTLTVASVKKFRPPASGRQEHFDAIVPGLCIRVSSTGARSWAVYYRHRGKSRRYTIGPYPAYSLSDARTEAGEILKASKRGEDLGAERLEKKRRDRRFDTVEGTVKVFIELYARVNNRSWKDSEQIFRIHVLPAWAARDVKSITRRDVIDLLDQVVERSSPTRANRVRAQLSRFFNWCLERELVDASPVTGTRPPGKELARDRVLTDEEVVSVWSAASDMGYPFGPFIQFLMLTSQRVGETSKMRWGDIDLEECTWSIPREFTKADRAHRFPLSPQAVAVLRDTPQFVGYEFVFTSGRRGDIPINGIGKAKALCDELSGVTDWRLHDLRRTAASGMARLGVPPHVVEKVQNRQSGVISGVSAVYNRYGYETEKREALDAWGRTVEEVIAKAKTGREEDSHC